MADNFDVTKHVLVPKHTKATQKDEKMLLEKYNLTARELPRIFVSDPAIQHLEVEEGDIVKIVRPSITAKEVTVFRRVARD
jgi:DNA-directed RNA polymerase subunit H (RpoH/RPB5)